ncbi:MAG TPA: CBS domain-containing protein [Lacipirellulaceae bacterium]|nr:CBS domain-containing protein [Lacipirellulaceae bacterium]
MLLREILEQKGNAVYAIFGHASAADVVAELVSRRIGSLLVRDAANGSILGIVTERDILRAVAANQMPLSELRVTECMSNNLVTVQPDDDVTLAMGLMTTHRIRHLPVMQGDKLCGLVSIGDVVKAQHEELEMDNYQMRSYIQGGASSVAMPAL